MIMARFTTRFEVDPQTEHDLAVEGVLRVSDRADLTEWAVLADAVRDAVLAHGRMLTHKSGRG